MFKNIQYWSNNRWAAIYGVCILFFGLQIYCNEANNPIPEPEKRDERLFNQTVQLMHDNWGVHISIEKAVKTVDSTKVIIDRLRSQNQALRKMMKMPKVEVHPGGEGYRLPVKTW